MITIDEIKGKAVDGEKFFAIGDNGKKYTAVYDAEFQVMFFCIPDTVKIVGYIHA